MSTTISARPRGLSWSRNPIHHLFSHSFPVANSRLVIDLQDVSNLVLTEVQYPIPAGTFGVSVPYLEDLMDPLLRYVRPSFLTPGAGAQVPEEMTTNIRGFKVRFGEAAPGALPTFTQDSFVTKAIKGGLGDMNFIAAAVVNDGTHTTPIALPANGRFLTHVPIGRLQRPDEWGWLLYLCLENASRYARYTVSYLDGTSAGFSRSLPNPGSADTTHRNWYIPTGVGQCGLDPFGKGVYRYTITVYTGLAFPDGTIEQQYEIQVDNRPYYHPFCLYYRNSLGGWDNLTLRGDIEHNSDAERAEYGRDINNSSNGTANWFNSSIRPRWKGFTGYMKADHLTSLQDMLLSTECALLVGQQWLPVRITTKGLKHFDTRDSLLSAAIELETAGSFTSYPQQLASLR